MQRIGFRGRGMRNHTSQFVRAGRHCLPLFLLAVLPATPFAQAQDATPPALDAGQVVQRLVEKNKERAAGLQHYLARRSYSLEYRGFPSSTNATMEVEVTYDAPGSKHFTIVKSTGPKLIQTRVFERLLEGEEQQLNDSANRSHSELSSDNYNFTSAG